MGDSQPQPTIGRIVLFKVSADVAASINKRRKDYSDNKDGVAAGAVCHVGNSVSEGDVFPMVITAVNGGGSTVNGQVLLDGNDVFWATSIALGDDVRQYSWPVITKAPAMGAAASVAAPAKPAAAAPADTTATPKVGDTCTMPDGTTPGTMQDDGTGTGTLVCTVAPASEEAAADHRETPAA